MQFIQSYYTDIGIKRKRNQDSLALLKAETEQGEVLLAVICDGMGGHQAGELASKVCVRRFSKWFKTRLPGILYGDFTYERLQTEWFQIIHEMNDNLVIHGKKNNMELGSTLTAFLFCQESYYAVHVGDSRGYVVHDGIRQITRDHSLLAVEIERGIITREEARHDKRGNLLLESIGITRQVNMEFYTGEVKPQSSFLLCTDGFWHQLEENELIRYLSGSQITDNKMMRMHLNYLTETVKSRGEKDNISAIGIVPVTDEDRRAYVGR